MRYRKHHNIKSDLNRDSIKCKLTARVQRQQIVVGNETYKKMMCNGCKYNQDECLKHLDPIECAKKGEKFK